MWMFTTAAAAEAGAQSDVQRDQLLIHLTTYIELHQTHKDRLKNTADYFSKMFLQTQEQESDTARTFLYGLCGGSVGAFVGSISGGVAGGLGAVAASALLSRSLNALTAAVGFFGGILGSVTGATCTGIVGGAFGAAAESKGHSADDKLHLLLWGVTGGATGACIGSIFGGKVGSVAGAIGGGLGGFCGVAVPVMFTKTYLGEHKKTTNSNQQKKVIQLEKVMQVFQPLIAELSVIHSISSRTEPGAEAGRVAVQSSLSLIAVSKATKAICDVQITPQTTSCWKRAAQQCMHMCEQLEMMQREAEKVRASWSKLH